MSPLKLYEIRKLYFFYSPRIKRTVQSSSYKGRIPKQECRASGRCRRYFYSPSGRLESSPVMCVSVVWTAALHQRLHVPRLWLAATQQLVQLRIERERVREAVFSAADQYHAFFPISLHTPKLVFCMRKLGFHHFSYVHLFSHFQQGV